MCTQAWLTWRTEKERELKGGISHGEVEGVLYWKERYSGVYLCLRSLTPAAVKDQRHRSVQYSRIAGQPLPSHQLQLYLTFYGKHFATFWEQS